MYCPYCKNNEVKVVDKRDNEETNTTRRRRECLKCGKRFTSYERVETVLLNVEKRSGTLEEFDREKLKRGILKAVKKRQIPDEKLEQAISKIENELMKSEEQIIKSTRIGELVLKEISKIDPLGALLFASVYKQFSDLDDVLEEIKRLNKA
jgi:transcriptional repressor NrdR